MARPVWDVRDIDAAHQAAKQLADIQNEISEIGAAMKQKAASIDEIEGTMELNKQISAYLYEAADYINKIVPGVEEAARQLQAIIASADSMSGEQVQAGSVFHTSV